MNAIKKVTQSWTYFQKGYSLYLSLPIGLFSLSINLYFIASNNVPFLRDIFQKLFPSFSTFLIFFTLIYPVGAVMGWVHYKKSKIYEVEQEITTLSNPYAREKIVPISLPTWEWFTYQVEKEGRETGLPFLNELAQEMRGIIEKSRQEVITQRHSS